MIDGFDGPGWRLQDISTDGHTITLRRGLLLPNVSLSKQTVFVPGPHGGLTVIHGGGNYPLSTEFEIEVTTDSITRNDGRSWAADGYAVLFANGQPMHIQVGDALETRTISGFSDAACPYVDPFPGCGVGSVMNFNLINPFTLVAESPLVPGTLSPISDNAEIHVVEPLQVQVTDAMNVSVDGTADPYPTSTLTCETFDFDSSGFKPDMQVLISGLPGPYTVKSVGVTTLELYNVALQTTVTIDGTTTVYTPVQLTVTGYDPLIDGGVRIGGDTITVGGPEADEVLAGPDSPLVVYGDTSQDGVWYSGHPYDVLGYEFGPKPFDPFTLIPDSQNEDDEWVFPLANPYPYAGNDVIDASALFADVSEGEMPTIGFTAYGGNGDDLIIGSQAGDHLAGGSGDDEIHGLRGVDHIYGDSGVNLNILTRALSIETTNASPLPSITYAGFINNGTTIEPYASPVVDLMEAGRDLLYGEGPGTISGDSQFVYDDIIFGDHGAVIQQVVDPNLPDARLQKIQTTLLFSIREIESRAYQNGADDIVFGNEGRDIIIGGAGNDLLDGDEGDDLLFGDQIFLHRRVVETYQTNISTGDISSGRFQTLISSMLYSRSDQDPAAAGVPTPNADNSGELLVDGYWRDYRDPDSPGIDPYPWWAEYLVVFDQDTNDEEEFHTFAVDDGTKGAGSFGNDHIAGGEVHDLIFGQMGADILEGDGGIERAFARLVDDITITIHSSASRTPDGCPDTTDENDNNATHAGTCDLVGDLDLVPSFDALTDGEDYIEGNAGNDIVFGGQGQDDILGGSSDFFSLTESILRPDGSDLLFGGSGEHTDRNDNGGVLPGDPVPADRHASDADVIVGDNGQIIRVVGLKGTDGEGVIAPNRYVTFNYDNYGAVKILVRGVSYLDYTPGGPDFRPDRFGLDPEGPCSGSPATDACSARLELVPGRNSWVSDGHWEIAGNDEVHGGLSDDWIYLGGGNDVAYGDADDDDIIGGWGNDWISGGVGQDGILGDDGRIFTSRNSDLYGEPLYGVAPLYPTGTCPEKKNVLCQEYLNQWIATPGDVQTAVINIEGDLKKTFDLTPFNLTPNALGSDQPLFDANNSDDVIFGGLGGEILYYPAEIAGLKNNQEVPSGLRGIAGDFLHAGAGDDAVAGGEAIWNAYTQIYDLSDGTRLPNAYRSDWTRPYNPGDLLHFGEDYDAWHDNGPIVDRLGEFAIYDEYDPRRTILLNPDGTVDKLDEEPNLMWFLNLDSDEGTPLNGCVEYLPNGTCVTFADRMSDGADVLAGDLGNDWLVGGTGQDTLWGGWGNDLLNSDDVMTIVGEGEYGDQKGRKIQPSPNDIPDTHPVYQDRAYGGAGLDILIGNTGGDRQIDWVGEFNSYIVPFAPFGIATNSRQVPPWLFEFLYSLSFSQGIDPTRDTDTGTNPDRNGEPDGELGLVIQKDHGLWQDQTGGPTDPQPGNIPGGRRDVLRSADFNDGSSSSFVPDSGTWEVQTGRFFVGPTSLGGDAVSVYYADVYQPQYFEVLATINTEKPTGGSKANTYLIFDYQGPEDFKFAGVNISNDKLEMGYRDEYGWHVVSQSNAKLKPLKDYDLLLALNGTTATLLVDNKDVFSYAFAPRVDADGYTYGLNAGLLGVGTNNSSGSIDNVVIQVIPPETTLELTDDFEQSTPEFLISDLEGAWTISSGEYLGTPSPGESETYSLADLEISSTSLIEIETTLQTEAFGGVIFDRYSDSDFKFAGLSAETDELLVGHYTARRGWVVDFSTPQEIEPDQDYELRIVIKGLTMSMVVDGQTKPGFVFNGVVVDGDFGLFTSGGTTTFDDLTFKTDDPAYAEPEEGDALRATYYAPAEMVSADTLKLVQLDLVASQALALMAETVANTDQLKLLEGVGFVIKDLKGLDLGRTVENQVFIDSNAAGHGWSFDLKGEGSSSQIDLLTVITHELGHVLGLDHVAMFGDTQTFMNELLGPGTRILPGILSSQTISEDITLSQPLNPEGSEALPGLVNAPVVVQKGSALDLQITRLRDSAHQISRKSAVSLLPAGQTSSISDAGPVQVDDSHQSPINLFWLLILVTALFFVIGIDPRDQRTGF